MKKQPVVEKRNTPIFWNTPCADNPIIYGDTNGRKVHVALKHRIMKTDIFKLFLMVIIFLCSCTSHTKDEYSLSSNAYSSTDEKLIVEIICQGNVESYQTLYDSYSDNFRSEELLAYSLIMANKYDYAQAYFDVFDILTSIPNRNASICASQECLEEGFYCLDSKTKQMAIDYFKQAIIKENITASEKLLNVYNKDKSFPIEELYSDKELIDKATNNIKKYYSHKDISK